MEKYLNKRIYTDIESYLVTEIDEVKGTAMAIQVEKRITPEMIPSGFTAHCPNLDREFAAIEPTIKDGAKAFRIKRDKNGIWGYQRRIISLALPVSSLTPEWIENKKNDPAAEIIGDYIYLYELTKTGKYKTTFEKLGTLSNYCGYFYDYNF